MFVTVSDLAGTHADTLLRLALEEKRTGELPEGVYRVRYAHDGTFGRDAEDLMKFDQAAGGWMDAGGPSMVPAEQQDDPGLGDATRSFWGDPFYDLVLLPAVLIGGGYLLVKAIWPKG